jgi:hypothetical protein
MRVLNLFRFLGTLMLILGLFGASVYATGQPQDQSQQQEPSQPQQPQSSPDMSQASQQQPVQIFAGKIVKSKGNLVLTDPASDTTYHLQNEDQAKQYVGKRVTVKGTLDPTTNMISISDIQPASSK